MTAGSPQPDVPPCTGGPPPRRTFFGRLTAAVGALAAGALGWPLARYFTGVTHPASQWVPLGAVTTFPLNQTRMVTFENPLRQPWDGHTAQTGVFVRRLSENSAPPKFRILAVNCAHLGCPVSWMPQSELFLCPCHGGVYDVRGERVSGPPPRGLFHCQWRIVAGELQVLSPHFPTLQDTEQPSRPSSSPAESHG